MRILILSAVASEIDALQARFHLTTKFVNTLRYFHGVANSHEIYLAVTGIGTTRGAVTATILCQEIKPDILFFMGTAGGLLPGQKLGDIVIGKEIVDIDLIHLPTVLENTPFSPALFEPHGEEPLQLKFQPHPLLLQRLLMLDNSDTYSAIIATSNTFPAPKEALQTMKELNCTAIEMEGSGIHYVAQLYNIPIGIIRIISNNLDADGNDLGTSPEGLQFCATRLADFMELILDKSEAELTGWVAN